MKPSHEYYNVSELIEKWSTHDNNINEMDILKWGASGQLQFSVWISTGEYYDHIDIIQEYQDGTETAQDGLLEGKEVTKHISCKKTRIDKERRIWKLNKKSIEFLLDDKKQDTVFPELRLDCDLCGDTQCNEKGTVRIQPTLQSWWLKKYPDYVSDFYDSRRDNPQFRHLYISKDDLVVTHEEMKKFEEEYFTPELPTPPYLDPDHFAYNVELALIIETWIALFIDKSHIDKKTAKMAARQYLEKYRNYDGDQEKYKPFAEETSMKDSSVLGRIAVQLNHGLLNKNAWKELKQTHIEEPSKT